MFDEKSVRRKLGFSISEEKEEGFIRTLLGQLQNHQNMSRRLISPIERVFPV